jgi:uncharacterized protein
MVEKTVYRILLHVKTYDKSISYLSSAIEGAEIEREQRIQALKKLAEYSAILFNQDK